MHRFLQWQYQYYFQNIIYKVPRPISVFRGSLFGEVVVTEPNTRCNEVTQIRFVT